MTTFFVINANIIATNGGISVNTPNLSEFTTAGSTSAANATVDDNKTNINVDINSTKFLLLFFIIIPPKIFLIVKRFRGKNRKSLEITLKA